jgi:hypothetical protein
LRWLTLGCWQGEDGAVEIAQSLVAGGGFMLVNDAQWTKRAKGKPVITGLRVVSLVTLLRESTWQAIV